MFSLKVRCRVGVLTLERGMMRTAKVSKIEKKYKDRKTGEQKSITIEFSKVVDRLNIFRSENPNGLVETTPTINGDQIIFKTRILKDKSNEFSAEATGHAMAMIKPDEEKQFEKLETISVGRALALLGYAAGGEIASSDEMDDFNKYRQQKIDEMIDGMAKIKTLEKLRAYFTGLGSYMAESRIIAAKDKRKAELSENN